MGAPHWPEALHIWVKFPEQRVVPGEQGPPPSDTSPVVSWDVSPDPSRVASAPSVVASDGRVESSIGAPSAPPLLLDAASSEESGPPIVLLVVDPPQEAAKVPANAPARANRIQGLEEIMAAANRDTAALARLPKKVRGPASDLKNFRGGVA
jgi:hypothetical protein